VWGEGNERCVWVGGALELLFRHYAVS